MIGNAFYIGKHYFISGTEVMYSEWKRELRLQRSFGDVQPQIDDLKGVGSRVKCLGRLFVDGHV